MWHHRLLVPIIVGIGFCPKDAGSLEVGHSRFLGLLLDASTDGWGVLSSIWTGKNTTDNGVSRGELDRGI